MNVAEYHKSRKNSKILFWKDKEQYMKPEVKHDQILPIQ